MTITKTFKELKDIDFCVAGLYTKNPTLKDSKFGYAYTRFYKKNYVKMAQDFNEVLTNLHIDYALEDPKTKEILTDSTPNSRGYKYDKAQLKALVFKEKETQDEWNAKEIECEPFISALVPENLTEYEEETLKGVLL